MPWSRVHVDPAEQHEGNLWMILQVPPSCGDPDESQQRLKSKRPFPCPKARLNKCSIVTDTKEQRLPLSGK